MKLLPNKTVLLMASVVLLVLSLPTIGAAQGRGRGLGRGHDKSWKCGVFVNCHDARDGRLDGRGPNRSRIGRRIYDDDYSYRNRRARSVNRTRVDRDGDGDFDRRDVLLGRQQDRWERVRIRQSRRQSRW